jgi:hypothetical protein
MNGFRLCFDHPQFKNLARVMLRDLGYIVAYSSRFLFFFRALPHLFIQNLLNASSCSEHSLEA